MSYTVSQAYSNKYVSSKKVLVLTIITVRYWHNYQYTSYKPDCFMRPALILLAILVHNQYKLLSNPPCKPTLFYFTINY